MCKVQIVKRYTREQIKETFSTHIYIFGDNDLRVGYGGQASQARDERNAIGIRVLKSPGVFYTDDELYTNLKKIQEDFNKVFTFLQFKKIIVIPDDGVGTGLARLKESAPKTFAYVDAQMNFLRSLASQ